MSLFRIWVLGVDTASLDGDEYEPPNDEPSIAEADTIGAAVKVFADTLFEEWPFEWMLLRVLDAAGKEFHFEVRSSVSYQVKRLKASDFAK